MKIPHYEVFVVLLYAPSTHRHFIHTDPRSGQSLCLCELCDWNSITCVLFAPKTKEKETKKDTKRQQKFWPLPGITGVWLRVCVFLSFISGKCHLAAETEAEPDPEAKTEQQQQQEEQKQRQRRRQNKQWPHYPTTKTTLNNYAKSSKLRSVRWWRREGEVEWIW